MPRRFIVRSLAFSSFFFAVFMPLFNELIEIFTGDNGSVSFWILLGAIVGLFFGAMQLLLHFRKINDLVQNVNEETLLPIREFEIKLNEKLDPAMDNIAIKLKKKGWKLISEDRNSGRMKFSVNEHRGWPYTFDLKLTPRDDGRTFLQVFINPPILERYLPDLGKSLRYSREFKSILI